MKDNKRTARSRKPYVEKLNYLVQDSLYKALQDIIFLEDTISDERQIDGGLVYDIGEETERVLREVYFDFTRAIASHVYKQLEQYEYENDRS